ncbi:UNKNOWN [Stylonychia lemnae]|uniref:Uncharacterized protein n=1 Tax=Stylonychia lemnae TaxID=5949 RepID=A0A078ARE6_STYLE|nr:UNKNOWN [Stylonychia lemnae]|eukprot:CDW85025.1 UNKNOWN [Stylonychia lemnae]
MPSQNDITIPLKILDNPLNNASKQVQADFSDYSISPKSIGQPQFITMIKKQQKQLQIDAANDYQFQYSKQAAFEKQNQSSFKTRNGKLNSISQVRNALQLPHIKSQKILSIELINENDQKQSLFSGSQQQVQGGTLPNIKQQSILRLQSKSKKILVNEGNQLSQQHANEIRNRCRFAHPTLTTRQNIIKKLRIFNLERLKELDELDKMIHVIDDNSSPVKNDSNRLDVNKQFCKHHRNPSTQNIKEEKVVPTLIEVENLQNKLEQAINNLRNKDVHEFNTAKQQGNQQQQTIDPANDIKKLKDTLELFKSRSEFFKTQMKFVLEDQQKQPPQIKNQHSSFFSKYNKNQNSILKHQDFNSFNSQLNFGGLEQNSLILQSLNNLSKNQLFQNTDAQTLKSILEDDPNLMIVSKMIENTQSKQKYIPKYSQIIEIADYQNVHKLINNPFMEMSDIKCEFNLIMKEYKQQGIHEVELGKVQNSMRLQDGKDVKARIASFKLTGVKLDSSGKYHAKMIDYLPFRFLPFVFFLREDQAYEVLAQIIECDDISIGFNTARLQEVLRGHCPAEKRQEVGKFYMKSHFMGVDGKSVYNVKIKQIFYSNQLNIGCL